LSGCTTEDALRFGWPKGVTPQAEQMKDLWVASCIAALVVGVVVWGLIFWAIIRYRRRGDEVPAQTRYNAPIEVLYTVIPFLIIAVLFYYTALVETQVEKVSKNPDVRVTVVAFKWNWRFIYAGEKGPDARDVETLGTPDQIPVLVVPTGKRIRFTEDSQDVIHSFWVPELLFKRDVIPGKINTFEVTITKPGSYVGRCAEFCGTYHSMMNFELRAVSPEDYQAYLAARRQGLSNPDALRQIGQAPFATTTRPFETRRTSDKGES